MIFSEQWLREWVDPAIDRQALMEQLTLAGLEVDGYQPVAARFSDVVIGEVLSVEPHPDAERLSLCQASDGQKTCQIVCGADNVRAGLKVPLAQVGATLYPRDGGEPLTIRETELRGSLSQGMLCSADELGLAESASGLMELPDDAPVGTDFRQWLGLDDIAIELDLTPNRGDCLSVMGLAREVGALNRTDVASPDFEPVAARIDDRFPVHIDAPQACPRYIGRVVRGIDQEAVTPLWLQEKLRRSGLRPIDPVVDVTNYVLLELGQPLHAFDLQQLSGRIRVRMASAGETLVLLDGREITLAPDDLLIADDSGPLALAGIMGGEGSAVTAQTRDVFLECAFFEPLAIAGRARRQGLHTDASHRYERGVDHQLQSRAMERATALLVEIAGGQPGPAVETTGELPGTVEVDLRLAQIPRLLGIDMDGGEVAEILQRLGFELLSRDENALRFRVPSFRFDVRIEADLIEELARIHGYDRLPSRRSRLRIPLGESPESRVSLARVRERLVSLGYQEVITYSFVEPELMRSLAPEPEAVALNNPISSDMSVMRVSLWPGLLQTLHHNLNRRQDRVRVFETGQVFLRRDDGGIDQPVMLAGLLYGPRWPQQWNQPAAASDFFDLKGDLQALLELSAASDRVAFEPASHPALHPGQSARIRVDGRPIGWAGTLDPRLQRDQELSSPAFVFEVELAAVQATAVPQFQPLSRYPAVSRDLAVVVDESVPAADIRTTVREHAGEHLVDLRIFDVYQGDAVGAGQKSMALGLTWQHPSRTLDDDDINAIIDNCVKGLETKLNAKLRN